MRLTYRDKIINQHLYINNKKRNYFEGWYFKHTDNLNQNTISFIVGISTSIDNHAFIQIIENITNNSYYIKFKLEDFSYNQDPFYIKIKDNYFSLEGITINIKEPKIKAHFIYQDITSIKKNLYSPNIMGPFAYLPFLECYHAIISLKHRLIGTLELNNQTFNFDQGLGYIEKDYGTSFPKKYIWLEGNDKETSIFLAIANIPVWKFSFKGLIGILEINEKEYRFATYYLCRFKIKKIDNNKYLIIINQGKKRLEIILNNEKSLKLISPKNGNMKNFVYESLNSNCQVILYYKKKKIFEKTFLNIANEIFNY